MSSYTLKQIRTALANAEADGNTVAAQKLRARLESASGTTGGVVEDVARSGAAGAVQGSLGLLSGVWGAYNAYRDGIDWVVNNVSDMLGMEPPQRTTISQLRMPTYEQSMMGADDLTKGAATWEPQTTAGGYARKVGQYAPGAALFGGGGGAAKVGTDVLRYGVLPGLADEAAGNATRGMTWGDSEIPVEPFARFGAAMAAPYAPNLLRKLATPNPIPTERADHVAKMTKEGVPMTAGQKVGSPSLMYAESTALDDAGRFNTDQMRAFTRAALKKLGISDELAAAGMPDDLFTPQTADIASSTIGRRFDELAARNKVFVDPKLVADISKAFDDFALQNTKTAPGVFQNTLQQMLTAAKAGKPLTGEQYQLFRSALSETTKQYAGKASGLYASAMIRSLDDALGRTIEAVGTKTDIAAYPRVRQQWQNYLAVRDASMKAGSQAAQGIISPAALSSVVKRQSKGQYAHGTTDMANLARSGAATSYPLPQSGTGPRLDKLANIGAAGTSAGIGGMAGVTDPEKLAGLAAMGYAVPSAAKRLMMSKFGQGYLGNQLMPRVAPPAAQNLLGVAETYASQNMGPR